MYDLNVWVKCMIYIYDLHLWFTFLIYIYGLQLRLKFAIFKKWLHSKGQFFLFIVGGGVQDFAFTGFWNPPGVLAFFIWGL